MAFTQKIFALSGILAACVLAADAQASRTLNTVERRIDTMNRQAKDFERDNMARDSAATKDPEAAKRSRQIRLEIEEDLKSLQSTYNNAVTALQTATELQSGLAGETARAARKHATRLKTNLALPAPDEKEEKAAPPALPNSERRALTALCRSIYELVANPMFENTGGLDAKNGSKARQDLDAIIRLAEHLSNFSEPK